MAVRVLRHANRAGSVCSPAVVAMGCFDGVHRGHRAVLRRVVEAARECGAVPTAVVFTARAEGSPPVLHLGSVRQRIGALTAVGIETIVLCAEASRGVLHAEERFVREWLIGGLHAVRFVTGPEVTLANGRADTPESLRALASPLGIVVDTVDPVAVDGCVISSREIRTAIADGELSRAATMLGRAVCVEGRVVHGHHRGRQIGFPTANVRLLGIQLPPDGVYAVRTRLAADCIVGVANIGFNPTFGDTERAVEVHLLDFAGDLYGRRMLVEFVERLRGERRFPDVAALVQQIRADVAAVRQLLPVS